MPDSTTAVPTRFVARQPIFDCRQKVAGYELLFRQTGQNSYTGSDPDLASKKVLDTAVLVGLNVLSNGHNIFVNCTRDSVVNGYVSLFPPQQTVVELLETVEPDSELVSACLALKKAGYRVALDDFVDEPRFAPLVKLADIIKVDFRLSPAAVRMQLARKYSDKQLLAEKVETQQEFAEAAKLGYKLFQGYFFCKPIMVSARDIAASRATYLRVLQVTNAPDLDFFKVERLVKSEPALCYRLFRYLNSAAFAFHTEIKSIVQALTLVGERDVRKWLIVACASMAAEGKPPELVNLALVRARFCELLGRPSKASESALFMLGLFSLMEAILDTSMQMIVEQVQLSSEVSAALLGGQSHLRSIYELVIAFEAAEWGVCEQLAKHLAIPDDTVCEAHLNAVEWAQGLHLD